MRHSPSPDAIPNEVVAPFEAGVGIIRAHLRTLPGSPGVYRMLSASGEALYVGKAKSLKKRVAAYCIPGKLPRRLQRMVAETRSMEFLTTHSEAEALLLESNLIKRLAPRYNILLRDDKSFAHIAILRDHLFPALIKHRGGRHRAGDYFGPFASTSAVNGTVQTLQRAFMLRTCSDAVFAARSRPCLQYQIKRCTAPCVGRVNAADYAAQVAGAAAFSEGRSDQIKATFAKAMMQASDRLDFEEAARLRDRIKALAAIQAHQDINIAGLKDADVIAAYHEGGITCIQLFLFRAGRNNGGRAYFPRHDPQEGLEDILGAFIAQFYADKQPAPLILVSDPLPETPLLVQALTLRAGVNVEIRCPERGDKKRLVDHARTNAKEALERRRAETTSQAALLRGIAACFDLPASPQRIEVYDNSHIQGSRPVGAMIVAGAEGFQKAAYRTFHIRSATAAGDDYAMLREVLQRRFGSSSGDARADRSTPLPDLVLIDGGQGQLTTAQEVMKELGLAQIPLVAIAKGPDRNAGRERFFRLGHAPMSLSPNDPVLYFLQRLRDEAHRFAIGAHRGRRERAIGQSALDLIGGVGPRRKKALLLHFGSVRAVAQAGVPDLLAVSGISEALAKIIYRYFHSES